MAIDSVPAPVTEMPPTGAVIDVHGLVKSFGTTRVLDQLALEVVPGEVHGLLGPNGAGKTTTLRILLGLLRADAGTVRVLGGDPWRDAASLHRRLAYVPGDVTLWPNLTGGEVIDMLGRMRGGLDRPRRDDLIARFDLDPTKKGRTYSKGNRQKVALVAALASDVELLLLDEPTAGLDPLMDATFREHIEVFRADGRTVLLSSHILSEVEALCDRVSIIRQGVVVESGTMAQLRHLTRTSVVAEVDVVPAGLDHLPGVHDVVVEGRRVTASVEGHGLSPLMASLGSGGLTSLTTAPPTLEELFLRHYRDVLGEPAAQMGTGDSPGASHRLHLGRRGKASA
jgi:ABC-2 type transport system ATP-binding protein